MRIKKKDLKGFLRISVTGEMEAYDAESFESDVLEMIKEGSRKIIIDLNELKYISSSGLRAILNIRSQLQREGGRLVLASLKDKVLEVFRVSKLLTVFEVVEKTEDIEEAR
jgi:anti-anti-sigma factor